MASEGRNTTEEIAAFVRERSSFVIVSHVKPDGDTLGSGLALGIALEGLSKTVRWYQHDAIPRNLRFLPGASRIEPRFPTDLPAATLYVFCDMSDASRAGTEIPPLATADVLNIDHHLGNTCFGGKNLILDTDCSTGSVVFKILQAMDVPITPEIATCLLAAIMTDTGIFMHSNTTADVLESAAELVRCGAEKERITEEIFANKRFAAIRLLGEALGSARLEEEGRFCWSLVDQAMLTRCEADGEDTEEIVQHLRSVEGVEAAALFKDYDRDVRVSLRSSGRVNVQAAAARLGGGGHFRASGLTFEGSAAAAVAAVRRALRAEGL